ncbi:sigma-70 family RNA polymerase sigma factor [Parabacteroides sp. OttesenSCG-928-G06]|nr:sigma-70 family RNA polymerase sigma factor [Parabacteroides sp. OttesenSCG-928-G06]
MSDKFPNSAADELLWKSFLQGDNQAYASLYGRYVDILFMYGMQFSPDRELVKDCVQDVFVKIYNHRKNLSPTDNVKCYLFLALKNTLFNVFQKDKSSYHIDTVEPVFSAEYSMEDRLIADELEMEQKEKMNQILNALTPRQKEVIYYRYVEGMNIDDICKIMDMNYQSVQNLIQRSLKKVRKTFTQKERSALSIKLFPRCI